MLTHLAATLAGALAHLFAVLPSFTDAAPFALLATAPVAIPDGADPDDDDDPDPAEVESIADAGKKLLEGLSAEEIEKQLTDDEDDGEALEPEGGAVAPAEPETAGADKAKPEIAEPEPEESPAPPAIKVTLPGIVERGEEDIEIEIDDKQIAERLRRLKNEVLRTRGEIERATETDDKYALIEAYQEEMESDPVGFHLNRLAPEQQLEVARALVLEHLDALAPDIEKFYNDPAEHQKARVELQKQLRKSAENLETTRAVKTHAAKCLRTVSTLIPDGTDSETAKEFERDARAILGEAARRGERVAPETIPAILSKRIKLYGFDKKPTPRRKPAAAPKAAAEAAHARPMSDKAREIAERRPNGAATQASIRRSQAARQAGSRVAPAGAGAAPVQLPALPPEAEQDIESMSRHLRQHKLPETWGATE